MLEKLIAHRRALHQIPELDQQLPKTRAYLEQVLRPLPCRILHPYGDAVCAFFDAGKEDAVAFRSDMDALPIFEKSPLSFCSRHEGAMHACGHDGHMAILLCFASWLAQNLSSLPHNVLLIFQPAEETTGGAKNICDSGILEQHHVSHIFGLHLWPSLPAGVIASRSGALMAQSSELTIEISGKSAHIARQEDGIDALDAGVQFVQRAYRMAKEFEPEQFRLLRFGRMQSGSARNAISAHTRLEGTLRTFSGSLHQALAQNLAEIARSLESELGCQISQHMSEGYPPVYNAPLLFEQVLQSLGQENLLVLEKPTLITEDFSFYQQRLPGIFFFLGIGGEQPLHSDRFNFDEQLLEPGLSLFQKLLYL